MSNKKNLPNIPIYIGDWERDCNVLSLESEAAWMRIVFKLWTKGKQNSIKIPTKSLQNLWRCSKDQVQEILDELIYNEIAEITVDKGFVKFTCRRFVKENELSEIRSEARKSGYKKKKSKSKNNQKEKKSLQNTEDDYENESEYKDDNRKRGAGEKVIEVFKKQCPDLPQPQKITRKRKSAIRARIQEYKPDDELVFFEHVFKKVSDSEFLNGNNDRGWKADFDWILNPNNFIKIIENKYQNGTRKKTINRQTESTLKQNLEGW